MQIDSHLSKDRYKVAYFNCTAGTHIGCQAVTDAHLRLLLEAGLEIEKVYFISDTRRLFTLDRSTTFEKIAEGEIAATVNKVDAIVINGEGSIHHGNRRELLVIADYAKCVGKRVYLVNSVLEEVEGFDDVLLKMDDLNVREPKSGEFLSKRNIPHRVVLDSFLEASFHQDGNLDFSGKIVCTDWHKSRSADVGEAIERYLIKNSASAIFLPFSHKSHALSEGWRHVVGNLATAECVITARHHGLYAAGLAGRPAVAMPSNTYKIEGTIKASGLPIPICTNLVDLEEKVKFALSNPSLFLEFKSFLTSQRPLGVFDKLKRDFPVRAAPSAEKVHEKISFFFKGLADKYLLSWYAQALPGNRDGKKMKGLNRVQ